MVQTLDKFFLSLLDGNVTQKGLHQVLYNKIILNYIGDTTLQ